MANAYKIIQSAKNFNVYPEVPLSVWLPAPVQSTISAKTGLVVFIFAHRTSYGFNVDQLTTETPAPNVYDDKSSVYAQKTQIVNLTQKGSMSPPLSPPVLSPDASGNYLSAYAFFAQAAVGTQQIRIADPGLATSPPSSPPIAAGRPVFDSGIGAVVFEVGNYSNPTTLAGDSVFDAAGEVSSDQPTIGASLITTAATTVALFEAAILMDSSSITPAAAVAPVVSQYQYADKYPAGSSQWIIFSSLGNGGAYASKGFLNPIEYTGGVLAISVK